MIMADFKKHFLFYIFAALCETDLKISLILA